MYILITKNYLLKQWELHKKFNKICLIKKHNIYTLYKIIYLKYKNFIYISNIDILTNNILKINIISGFFCINKIKYNNVLYTKNFYKFIFNIKSPKLLYTYIQ